MLREQKVQGRDLILKGVLENRPGALEQLFHLVANAGIK